MKIFYSIVLLLSSFTSFATNYFVSTAGNDANNGTSTGTSWKTLAKVNSFTFSPGDIISFNRGDVFVGNLTPLVSGSSGSVITFNAYGTGVRPLITGLVTLSNWTLVSTGVWSAPCPSCKFNDNVVLMDGILQNIGRTPNASAGYVPYTGFSGTTSMTDNVNLTGTPNWTNAELVMRKNQWVIDRSTITNQSGATLTYAASSTYVPVIAGYGYFIQNDLRTVDALGEWFFNTSSLIMNVYLGTDTLLHSVKTTTVDTLVNLNNKSWLTFDNINFTGANMAAFALNTANHITVQNCTIAYSGVYGVWGTNTSTFNTFTNDSIMYSLTDGITWNNTCSNWTMTNCIVHFTGMIPGMCKSGDLSSLAINAQGKKAYVQYNTLDSVGYRGISFEQDSTSILNNNIVDFCLIKGDGGAIYSYLPTITPHVFGSTVMYNIIGRGIGNEDGALPSGNTYLLTDWSVRGIYMDGFSQNVLIQYNTVYDVPRGAGFYCSILTQGLTIRDNTFYNTQLGLDFTHELAPNPISNIVFKNNIVYSKQKWQKWVFLPEYVTTSLTPSQIGTLDSNYYCNFFGANDNIYYANENVSKISWDAMGLSEWQSKWGQDLHSKAWSGSKKEYTIGNLVGTNKFFNGIFNGNTNSLAVSSDVGNMHLSYDAAALDTGAAKITFDSTIQNRLNSLLVQEGLIGSISSTKNYIVGFDVLGTTSSHTLGVYLRSSASPFASLYPVTYVTFGTTRQHFELLIQNPTDAASAQLAFKAMDSDSTFWIDNITFFEANVTVADPNNFTLFQTNPSLTPLPITLTETYIDAKGNFYDKGTYSIPPYGSLLLTKFSALLNFRRKWRGVGKN